MRTVGTGLLAVVALATLTACPPAPSAPNDGGGPATACAEAPMRLAVGCAGSQCHSAGAGEGRPDFVTPGELEKLIGKTAHEPCPNGQSVVINPTRPFSGVLFERLNGDACYGQMPRNDAPPSQKLTDADRASLMACLKSWVESKLP